MRQAVDDPQTPGIARATALSLLGGLLGPESLREMHRVQFLVDPAHGGSGLAWGVETSDGQHLIYHGGELPEQSAHVLIDVKYHIGVIVLANAQMWMSQVSRRKASVSCAKRAAS